MRSFLFFLSLVYWPFCTRLLACLIRATILHFSFCLQKNVENGPNYESLVHNMTFKSNKKVTAMNENMFTKEEIHVDQAEFRLLV